MPLADEDLRDGSPPAALLHHDLSLSRVLVHVDLADRYALAGKEGSTALTITAPCGRVHDRLGRFIHDFPFLPSALTNGRFSCRQRWSPPRRVTTFGNPSPLNARAAAPEARPFSQ